MQEYELSVFLPILLLFCITLLSSIALAGSVVMHNGKPFFPIGVYHYPEGLPYEPRFEELANAGFNAVLSGLTSSNDFMDAAEEHGIGVIAVLGWNMVLDEGGQESKKATLREHIERLKDHPALLGYEAPDEIAWVDYDSIRKPGTNLQGLLRGYEYMKSLDADHPVWMNHAPRNAVEYLRSYSEAGDILGTDIYPVPEGIGHSDLDQSLNCVGQYTEKLDQVGGGKPIYMVLQGFSWKDLPGREAQTHRQPNWVETRFMAYDAICHGANGVIYWGMSYIKASDEIWNHLKRIASEMRDLTPVLLTGEFQAVQASEGLEVHLKQYEGYHYAFVLNTKNEELGQRRIDLPSDWAGEIAVLFEDRSLLLEGSTLVDSFLPYEVHIYTDDPRADIEVDVTNPRLVELGKKTTLTVTIRNRGPATVPPFNISLGTAQRVLTSARVSGIDGYASRLLNLDWTPEEEGEILLELEADPDEELAERSRQNNVKLLSVVVSQAGPDLRVESFNMSGQHLICAEVVNSGLLASPPTVISCTIGPVSLPGASVEALAPGESTGACWTLDGSLRGALLARFSADNGDQVTEMLEDNNDLTETIYLEHLIASGPVLHVKGLEDNNLWLIKYDDSAGALSGTDACTLVWGIEEWRRPSKSPRGSREVEGKYESPMQRGPDGLWYVVIPNQEGNSLVFRFRDHQANGTNWDDNDGRDWTIVRTSYVLDMLAEYQRLVLGGISLGANMTTHETKLGGAWAMFNASNLSGALDLAEGHVAAGVDYVRKLREFALDEVNSASQMGIDVEKHERDLYIAGKILDAGKYDTAERYCTSVISKIAEEKANIPEASILALLSLSLPLGWRCFRRVPD